jgi:hypothetical protein
MVIDSKYKRAREELGITLKVLAGWINEDLAMVNQHISVVSLFEIEQNHRKKYDIKFTVAMKYYGKIFAKWERDRKIKEIDQKYGG